jgi:hypothetical protein
MSLVALPFTEWYEASNSDKLVIPSKIGERHILLKLFAPKPTSADEYFDLFIGSDPVGRFYSCYDANYSHLITWSPQTSAYREYCLFDILEKEFGIADKPNASEDEAITIQFSATKSYIRALILKSVGGDVKSRTVAFGSDAKRLPYIFWVTHSGNLTASAGSSAVYGLDSGLATVGMPTVSDNNMLPRGYRFTLKSIALQPRKVSDTRTDRFKIWLGDTELWTKEQRYGLLVDPTVDNQLKFDVEGFKFFKPQEEIMIDDKTLIRLLLQVSTPSGGTQGTITANSVKLGLIGVLERAT